MKHLSHKLAAAVTVGLLTGTSIDAQAAYTLSDMTNNIAAGSGGLTKMTSMVAYVAGGALGVAGLFKLKQHVDNPGQTPMKDGLVRLGCGGGLLTLPVITTAMQGTISADETGATAAGDTTLDWDSAAFTD